MVWVFSDGDYRYYPVANYRGFPSHVSLPGFVLCGGNLLTISSMKQNCVAKRNIIKNTFLHCHAKAQT